MVTYGGFLYYFCLRHMVGGHIASALIMVASYTTSVFIMEQMKYEQGNAIGPGQEREGAKNAWNA